MELVDSYTDSFNEHSDALREKREAEDFDDLQHTLSGVETGQQTRHGLYKNTDGSVSGKGKRKSVTDQIRETLDWLLLNDPIYKQVHENLMASIRSAQTATQATLERVMSALAFERTVMDELLSRAAKLPDATKVFKDKKGVVRNEDSEVIPPELAATIQWTGNEPSYEEYLTQKQRIEELETYERELRGYETELGEIHVQGNNNVKPLTQDELGGAQVRVDEIEKRIEKISTDLDGQLDKKSKADLTTNSETVEIEKKEPASIPPIKIGN